MRNNLSDGSFKAKILIERQLLLIYCMNNNDSQSFYSIVISLFIKPELRKCIRMFHYKLYRLIINNILSLLLKYVSSNICSNLFNFFRLKVMKQLSLWILNKIQILYSIIFHVTSSTMSAQNNYYVNFR